MIPLIPALVLALLSFIASAFVILRIVVPILPPHPLSKRVSPAEFGLPTFRSLSPADKSHLWLACLDLFALAIFIWEVIDESIGTPPSGSLAFDPAYAIRLWIVVTIRQTCLLIVAAVTLLHVRMAQSVSFGAKHWMLWAPTALLIITSTIVAGLLSGTGVNSLFYGLIAYSATIGVLSSIAFGYLVRTLFAIKKNLSSLITVDEAWPPVREMEEKRRPSFATEEIDAIRDGASWLTSNGSSRRGSISTWSFSTHHTVTTSQHHGQGRPQKGTHSSSVPAKSSFWFGSTTPDDVQIPPVPPLPSPYGPVSPSLEDPDPFRRDLPPLPDHPRPRFGSQSSWLTSSNGSHTTMTTWSYPATHHEGSVRAASVQDFHTAYSPAATRPTTPALADAQVLGGYGYAPGGLEAEKGFASSTALAGTTLEISLWPAIGWSVVIWLPLSFSLPYLISFAQNSVPSTPLQILLTLSVTLSSPLLALNLVLGSPFPIPVGLFESQDSLSVDPNRPLIHGSLPPHKWSHEYKRSTSCSVTVVEGRRSGDVWLSKGDAIDGKGKVGRAVAMLNPRPKLSVLPPEENDDVLDMPPVPFHDDSLPVNINGTPLSENSVQFGRLRKDSKTSSHLSGPADDSLAFASRIMIAQRHYSALAQTVVVPGAGSPAAEGNHESVGPSTLVGLATGATANKRASHSSHLRSRSVSSVNTGPGTPTKERNNISPPPSFPLPPTPPNVRAARLAMLAHKKSFSSGHDFSFKAVDDINEIDAMTAGVLPLLVPGLKVGEDMKIKHGDYTPPSTFSKSRGKTIAKKLTEFGEDFSSPEVHSTPARTRQPRRRKESHKRNHFSLPSLGLGKEGVQSLAAWGTEIRNALEHKVGYYTAVPSQVDIGRRNTVLGVESLSNQLQSVEEEEGQNTKSLGRTMSTRSLGLRADVPHGVDSARASLTSIGNVVPPSAASTVTLFEDFEAGLESPPQAESTPHNSVSQKPTSHHPPPPMPDHRRSTIRYIKSENIENAPVTYPMEEPTTNVDAISAISSFAQWSSRAVRPLVPKASKLQRTPSDASIKEGLRPLALLQDRSNVVKNNASNGSPTSAEIRPLTIGKRQKARNAPQDENVTPGAPVTSSPRKHKKLKSLKLARSETSKVRGILRKTEVLPEVVVRPPSTSEHQGFAYNFSD